ncbi:MAG: YebC/PmpR family DNA-binding transcriptional regulator [Candidatus Paceibacterota bacterium]
MSGHSKWSTIKRKKQAADQERSKLFSKLSRLITVAVRVGGGVDEDKNVTLRLALHQAKAANMPKDTINRAIDKARGGEGESLSEVVYGAFGPYNTALIVDATTDNSNRTHAEVRGVIERAGGKMGSAGSVMYLFNKCGIVVIKKSKIDEKAIFVLAEALSALDIESEGDEYELYIPFQNIGDVHEKLGGVAPEEVGVCYRSKTPIKLTKEQDRKLEKLIDSLTNLDDVHNVFVNTA